MNLSSMSGDAEQHTLNSYTLNSYTLNSSTTWWRYHPAIGWNAAVSRRRSGEYGSRQNVSL